MLLIPYADPLEDKSEMESRGSMEIAIDKTKDESHSHCYFARLLLPRRACR